MEEVIEKTDEVESTENTQENEQETTTYSQSELDSHISKAVAKAIEKKQAQWEENKQAELEKAKVEAAEYARMTQKEKEEAEYSKRLKDLEKREKELNDKALLSEIKSDLQENNLPLFLADSLLSIQDNAKIKESITGIKEKWNEAINEQVKAKLRQDTPTESTKEMDNDPFTKILNKYK